MRKPISNQIIFTVDETGTQINKQSRQLGSRGEKRYEYVTNGFKIQPCSKQNSYIYIYIKRERERERGKYVGWERP